MSERVRKSLAIASTSQPAISMSGGHLSMPNPGELPNGPAGPGGGVAVEGSIATIQRLSFRAQGRSFPAGLAGKQPPWIPDSASPCCLECKARFTFTTRRHHCRLCGGLFCSRCTNHQCSIPLFDANKPLRICSFCDRARHQASLGSLSAASLPGDQSVLQAHDEEQGMSDPLDPSGDHCALGGEI